jgi:hypothetical protein
LRGRWQHKESRLERGRGTVNTGREASGWMKIRFQFIFRSRQSLFLSSRFVWGPHVAARRAAPAHGVRRGPSVKVNLPHIPVMSVPCPFPPAPEGLGLWLWVWVWPAPGAPPTSPVTSDPCCDSKAPCRAADEGRDPPPPPPSFLPPWGAAGVGGNEEECRPPCSAVPGIVNSGPPPPPPPPPPSSSLVRL